MIELIARWQASFAAAILEKFGHQIEPPAVPFTFPPDPSLGDAATPVAFSLAKALKRPPQAIASELGGLDLFMVREVRVAGGYINLFLERAAALKMLCSPQAGKAPAGKVIVEHTNINPNKAAHVGHLRNAILGDTLVRCLRHLGQEVEVQNYIDDTGVQVADVVVGFQKLLGFENQSAGSPGQSESVRSFIAVFRDLPPELRGLQNRQRWAEACAGLFSAYDFKPAAELDIFDLLKKSSGTFDSFCWHLYSLVGPWYEKDEANRAARLDALLHMEEGSGETAAVARLISEEMVESHLGTMGRLGIGYDLLPHESDIIGCGFWSACFEKLKASGSVHKIPDDSHEKNRGCWVMALSEKEGFQGLSDADKVIVRSNGTVTYIGKDLAYQLWKFGLLGKDFGYVPAAGHPGLWRTTAGAGAAGAPGFGAGERVINVIDVRQSYLQRIVKEGLGIMGHREASDKSVHFSYEMVALSQKTAAEFELKGAIALSEEDRRRPFVEMSGRKGLGIMADDLVESLAAKASEEIRRRDPETPPEDVASRAISLAVGALRFYMIKDGKNIIIPFDFEQALAFEGETGPYIQYACVRAENILRKAAEKGLALPDTADPSTAAEVAPHLDEEAWALLSQFLRVPVQVRSAVENLDLNIVARHFYGLTQSFHSYYHDFPVLQEPDESRRRARLYAVALFGRLLREGLMDLLGISVPEKM